MANADALSKNKAKEKVQTGPVRVEIKFLAMTLT